MIFRNCCNSVSVQVGPESSAVKKQRGKRDENDFVRHGQPNYKEDCLTELGHLQGKAVAKRLADERLDRILSSSCGRAAETAMHIAEMHGIQVEQLDFMREIAWKSIDGTEIPERGHPWKISDNMVAAGENLLQTDWEISAYYAKSVFGSEVQRVAKDFDGLMETLGYKREGKFYRVCRSNVDNIVMVSHGGSSTAVFAHLFNLSAPFVCQTMRPDFTAITVVTFDGEDGQLISPRFEIMNDARHILGCTVENVFDR
ncbi:MAG: histidine phosphatase family protein [Clostridia bacterium]|nr:histidine phosphatase family protein [Clostridia bacterium]